MISMIAKMLEMNDCNNLFNREDFFFSRSQLKMKNKTVILRTFKRGHSLVGMIKLSRFYKPFYLF